MLYEGRDRQEKIRVSREGEFKLMFTEGRDTQLGKDSSDRKDGGYLSNSINTSEIYYLEGRILESLTPSFLAYKTEWEHDYS